MHLSVVVLVLTEEVSHALNVTVTPGPVVMVTEKDNVTLSCLVSQRKWSNSVLILRWFFTPPADPTPLPPPSLPSPPPSAEPTQFLIVKMGIKKMKLYGNYTRGFPSPKFRLYEETEGESYRLCIFSVTRLDQGFYTCKVQEIRKLRNTWRASSNGVYLCAVVICSLGLLSIFFFSLVLTCQYFHKSGETVTSSSSSSSSSPKTQRRDLRAHTDRGVTITPPKLPVEPPPHIPAKPRVSQEDSLTYAELELVRPRSEPQASSSPDPAPSSPDTVYAQILFQEKQL
uniref:V-set and transmembrane domain containing 4a n=1 Tax=Cynoglossus semilaevis TaxID=244447 RepID=A0A3P8VE57_CYNSE